MATSQNLGLYLPTRDDYISVKRDISDNMEIIDEAVGNNTNNITSLNNKTNTITSTQTSIVGLISSISGDGIQTFYYENAYSLTDYPTVLTNLGAIYRAYITIKKYVAVAEISITAVLFNGHPVTVTGVNINTVNYWEDTLDTLDNKISIQYDSTPYTTLNQIKAFLNSVNSSLSDNQWKEVRFNMGGTDIDPFGAWSSYSGRLTRFTSTVFICEVLNISGNEIQICRDGDTWNIVSLNGNVTRLLYAGSAIDAINIDLQKYKLLQFVTGYGQVLTISHNAQANEELHAVTSRYYSSAIPLVMFVYNFQINNTATGIYIDTANSKQVNINSDGTVTEVAFNNEMKFIKVYGTRVINE